MKGLFLAGICVLQFFVTQACRVHNPPPPPRPSTSARPSFSPSPSPKPNTFLGTVEQGCTPGSITSISQLLTDPTKCDLPLAGGGCNICKLRLYAPEKTSSRFLVQPLGGEFSTTPDSSGHIEGTKCRCDEGCYFHQSSISRLGGFPLPSGPHAVGTFSEPFACYSGISMPSAAPPTFTYLIWCENDGGCPNNVVARYNFLIRFELLSPNRPAVKSIFAPKFVTLPKTKCLLSEINEKTRKFLTGTSVTGPKPTKNPKPGKGKKGECKKCRRDRDCASGICYKKKCLLSTSDGDKARCGLGPGTGGPGPVPAPGSCNGDKKLRSCVRQCLSA